MPIENSAAKNFVAADSEFDSKNCVTADLEIGGQTMPLPVQKSAAKNYAAAGSEIGSKKLCRCQFKNRQPKTVLLPIQNSATMVESFRLYFFFFCVYIIQSRCIGKPFHGFSYFERCYVIVCLKCYVEYLPFDTFVRTCNENCNGTWM
jgi:hypothetical protein